MIEKIPQSPAPGGCPTSPTTHNPWHSLSFSIFNFAFSIVLLAACHEEPLPADPADNAIPFEMVFSAASRVATDADFRSTWEEGDAIGIFAVKHDPGTAGYLARDGSNYINNARLTRTGGKWVPDPGTELWWSDDGKVLDFYAYYPYSGTATDPMAIAFSASADQNGTTPTRQPAYNASDILAAKATGNGTMGHAKGSTVTLSFRHVLAMVQVTVDPGYPDRSPGAMKNLSVDLLACSPSGTLDLSAGTATTAGNVTRVTMYRPVTPGDGSRDAFTFRALVPPQTIAKGTRPYVVNSGGERFPATVLTDPLELTGGNVTRFGNTLQKRGIRSAADLVAFSEAWNAATSTEEQNTVITTWSDDATPHGTVHLLNDIDMNGVTNFTPIGNNNYPFTGTFDGGGHTISNLTVTVDGNYAGLFGYCGGTIRNVTMKDCHISATGRYAGNIAGFNAGDSISGCSIAGGSVNAKQNSGGITGENIYNYTITGCTVTNTTISTTKDYCGGIAGHSSGGTITRCTVTHTAVTSGNYYAGGIIGDQYNGTTSGCTVTDATIEATQNYSGGIAGRCNGNNSSIQQCTVTGSTVTKANFYAGGITGENNSGTVSGCSVTGSTTTEANWYAGGITGENINAKATVAGCNVAGGTVTSKYYSGGIAGWNSAILSGCSVTGGTVTGENQTGGIAGWNSATISGCIAATEMKGKNYNGLCVGKNDQTITACYCEEITGINNVGKGDAMGCTSFDKDKVKETDNFFIAGNPSPIERMNTALQTAGATVRWTTGNADSGWYPVIIEN